MKNQFIKVITKYGKIVWINVDNIVSVTEAVNDQDSFVVLTNATDGEGRTYVVEGSPEVFLDTLDIEQVSFM